MQEGFIGFAPHSSKRPRHPLIGMFCLIAAQAFLFLGLCSMFLFFQLSGKGWPPPGSPRLTLTQPIINLAVLLLSSVAMRWAGWSVRKNNMRALSIGLLLSLLLGGLFLANQVYSFFEIGLPIGTSLYIAILYILIALHGGHIIGGLIFLGITLARTQGGDFNSHKHLGVDACEIFWHFVVWIWVVLFGLLYLL